MSRSEMANKGRPRMRTVTNLAVLGMGELATRGLTFLAFVHIARVLDPSAFGLIETALAVMMFATLGVEQGFGILGAREIARDGEVTRGLVNRVVSTQFALALVVFGLLVGAAWGLPIARELAALLTGFAVSLFGVPLLLNWVFQGRGEMLWYAAPAVLRQAVFLGVALVVIGAPEDAVWLAVAEVAAVASAGVCWLVVYRRKVGGVSVRPGNVDLKLFRDGSPIGGSQLIWALRMYLPVVAVSALLGAEATGYFGTGHRIVMVFQALVSVYFTNLLPNMSLVARSTPAALGRMLRRSMLLLTFPTLALAVAIVFAAPLLLTAVFGSQYAIPEAARSIAVLGFTVPLLGWRRHGRTALIVLNLQTAEFRCALVGIVLLVVLLPLLVNGFGIVGAGWAMVASELVATALTWGVLVRALRRGPREAAS